MRGNPNGNPNEIVVLFNRPYPARNSIERHSTAFECCTEMIERRSHRGSSCRDPKP